MCLEHYRKDTLVDKCGLTSGSSSKEYFDTAASGSKPTRNATKVFGHGKSLSVADAETTGAKLPTYSQAIRCYMYLQQYMPGLTK